MISFIRTQTRVPICYLCDKTWVLRKCLSVTANLAGNLSGVRVLSKHTHSFIPEYGLCSYMTAII